LALTLTALLLAAGPAPGTGTATGTATAGGPGSDSAPPGTGPGSSAPAGATGGNLWTWAGFGAVRVGFSYPLALVRAGVGSYLIAVAAFRRRWARAAALVPIGLLWAASFTACFVVSHRILSKERFIWDWWDFAFLRLPPRTLSDLAGDAWQVLNVF